MKIREIIVESAEQEKVKEVDLLKDISDSIESAYKILKNDPEVLEKGDGDTEEVDESVKGKLKKLAAGAVIGLSALSAQADAALGSQLATCGGVMFGLGKAMIKSGASDQGSNLLQAGQRAYELSQNHGMFNREFSDAKQSMEYGGANAVRQGQSILAQCHQTIQKAVKLEEKAYAERQAYLNSPAGKAEMERINRDREQRAEQHRLENERAAQLRRDQEQWRIDSEKQTITKNYNQWLDNTNDRIVTEIGKMLAYKEFTANANPIFGKKDWQTLSEYAAQLIQKMAADIDSSPGSLTSETFKQKMMESAKETYQKLSSTSQSAQGLQDEILKAEGMFNQLAAAKPRVLDDYKRQLSRVR